jgi:hypothetical protein
MDNPGKLATHATQDEEEKQTSTNNVSTTWALLQTTEGKEHSNIVFIRKT